MGNYTCTYFYFLDINLINKYLIKENDEYFLPIKNILCDKLLGTIFGLPCWDYVKNECFELNNNELYLHTKDGLFIGPLLDKFALMFPQCKISFLILYLGFGDAVGVIYDEKIFIKESVEPQSLCFYLSDIYDEMKKQNYDLFFYCPTLKMLKESYKDQYQTRCNLFSEYQKTMLDFIKCSERNKNQIIKNISNRKKDYERWLNNHLVLEFGE